MSMEFGTMRNSLTTLLLVACVLGNPISYKASSISSNISPTNKDVSFVVHNIKPRSSDSFEMGDNLLDMKEETMELAIEEDEDHEATQRTMLRQFLQRSDPVDSLFDLGENVLDMSEETMELAMEEEEGKIEVVDTKENPVQAEVNSSPFNKYTYIYIICTSFLFFFGENYIFQSTGEEVVNDGGDGRVSVGGGAGGSGQGDCSDSGVLDFIILI